MSSMRKFTATPTVAELEAEVERLTGERDRQYDQNVEQIARIAQLQATVEALEVVLKDREAEIKSLSGHLIAATEQKTRKHPQHSADCASGFMMPAACNCGAGRE